MGAFSQRTRKGGRATRDDRVLGRAGAGRRRADGHAASAGALRRALTFWTRPHGVPSPEHAGRFEGTEFDPAVLFAAELDRLPGR
ncbi:hypothetical protein [Streptomyces lancefieldiae]|uniref:hypothetical protein n=1 Tax=Streptomyces lancefieldiae TaxID=3075520 RepID=UPI00374E0355